MNWEKIESNFREKLIPKGNRITFDSEEEYFYILGQFISYIFNILGGIHKYNREFNYLTNPYIPLNMYELGKRNIKFLKRINERINIKPSHIYKSLIDDSHIFIKDGLNERTCSDSFFKGLHSENLIEESQSMLELK